LAEAALMSAMDKDDASASLAANHADCVRRIAGAQDQAAFAVLFDFYGPRVKAFLLSRRIDPATAEDLAQEVMLTVWHKAGQYQADKAGVSTWVFTIARNRMIDHRRAEGRRKGLHAEDPSRMPEGPATPEDDLFEKASAQQVARAMAELSGPQAEVMRLSFIEGESHHKIARRLALPLGTVKSRIRLARQRLFEFLGDHNE
jgi:RNA polymerase sigma-70 factor (ECF subfamily)